MRDAEPYLIIGAGPAGVSAAHALLDAGRHVLLLDAGDARVRLPPADHYLRLRFGDAAQWHWQLGNGLEALEPGLGSSPKLRVPGYRDIFSSYAAANKIRGEDGFHVVGALAAGGLSNAWGCGVAAFSGEELGELPPSERQALTASYERVALRMGLSGASDDELAAILNVDRWAAPPIALGPAATRLWARRSRVAGTPFRLGRARVAVLSEPRGERGACDRLGLCLWGCPRSATWSAAQDLALLQGRPGFAYLSGVCVESLQRADEGWHVHARGPEGARRFEAREVLLAAGALATTRLVLHAAQHRHPVRLASNPMAAFLAVVPGMLGAVPVRDFGLAQLSFALHDETLPPACGNLFSTAGLPVSEFLEHVPLTRDAARRLLRVLLPAAMVGNIFLPGSLSEHTVQLGTDGVLSVRAAFDDRAAAAFAATRRAANAGLRRLGAWMLPGSFVPGAPGADIHYAGTLPLRANPGELQCHPSGEVAGLPGLYVLDGALLPELPAKSHTLTIAAHADRIATALAHVPN